MATKYFFQILSKFSTVCQNVARMEQNIFFKSFKRLPKCCQNGNKKILSKFAKIFKRLPECYQNDNIFIFSNFFKFVALVKMLPEWQDLTKRSKILKYIMLPFWQALENFGKF
jgi:hypothetical protein